MKGEDLKAARIDAGFSQRELAARAEVHHGTVQYWERQAEIDPLAWGIQRIAKAMGWRISRPVHTRACHEVLDENSEAMNAFIDQLFPGRRNRRLKKIANRRVSCGARTRKGKPCCAKSEPGKMRCRFHGGMSTGPRTQKGRERIAEAQRRRWVLWHNRQQAESKAER